jgi:hypothetical protein
VQDEDGPRSYVLEELGHGQADAGLQVHRVGRG